MTRYLIEDLNTHCTYEFYKYADAYKKYDDLKRDIPNPKLIMTSFTPDYKQYITIKKVIDSTV